MKYTKILGSPCGSADERYILIERVCSTCCKKLKGDEKFCPECGHKLKFTTEQVPEKCIIDYLNKEPFIGSSFKPEKRTKGDVDLVTSVTAKEDSNVSVYKPKTDSGESHYVPTCPYGLDKDSCGHLTPKGGCTMCVCTSIPPQYRMCPFRGHGFIFCEDAGEL